MVFTEEQLLLQKSAREFAENEIRPRLNEIIDSEKFIPLDLLQRMGELGFIGLMVKKENGGLGLGVTELCIVTEELSKVCPTVGLVLMCVAPGLCDFEDSPAFKELYLDDCLAGRKVFDAGVTPPEGHTNTPEWQVIAKKVDGGYLINGTKLFVSCSLDVGVHEVFGLDEEGKQRIFIIPGDAEGFTHNAPEVKFGFKGSGGGTVTYKDVFCPDNMAFDGGIGDTTFYFYVWLQCAAIALGTAEGALDQAIEWANTRTVDFKPLGSIGYQAQRIAMMKARVMACNALLYAAAEDFGSEDTKQDAFAKTLAAKTLIATVAYEVTKECVKLHGGFGYSDVSVYHYFADAVGCAIADQTTEVLLQDLAPLIGLPAEAY